jgi:hypothetical protein
MQRYYFTVTTSKWKIERAKRKTEWNKKRDERAETVLCRWGG